MSRALVLGSVMAMVALVCAPAQAQVIDESLVIMFCDPPDGERCSDDNMAITFAAGDPEGDAEVPITGSNVFDCMPCEAGTVVPAVFTMTTASDQIQGWSIAVAHDEALMSITDDDLITDNTAAGINAGNTPFFQNKVVAGGFISAIVLDLFGGSLLPKQLNTLLRVNYAVNDTLGADTIIEFKSGELGVEGSPPVDIIATDNGRSKTPRVLTNARVNVGGGVAEICDNQQDDDGDGAVDCDDSDCAEDPACAPATEICDNQQDDDGDGAVDCDDSDCAEDPACAPATEICDNQQDDDGDGAVDCDDSDCAEDPACAPGTEICDNQQDDDGDGAVDCDDSDCAEDPACAPATEICDNQQDDDGDGAVDCDDSDCAGDPACPPDDCPADAYALYFGPAATGDAYTAGDNSMPIVGRHAADLLGFQFGVKINGQDLSFSGDLASGEGRPLIELVMTDDQGNSQTPAAGNTGTLASGDPITMVERGSAIAGFSDGDFFEVDLNPGVGGPGMTVGYVSDLDGDANKIPATGAEGCPVSELVVATQGDGGLPFNRGDADGNGKINVTDGVLIVQGLVGNLPKRFPGCDDILDANGDGSADLSDAVFLLEYIFISTAAEPPAPFRTCEAGPATCQESNCTPNS